MAPSRRRSSEDKIINTLSSHPNGHGSRPRAITTASDAKTVAPIFLTRSSAALSKHRQGRNDACQNDFHGNLSRPKSPAAAVVTRPARRVCVWIAILVLVSLVPMSAPAWAQVVDLGTAADYGVLGASAVTNTGATVITGDLGISPNGATSVTGFPPGVVIGNTHFADAAALQAQNDLTAAYNDLAGRACDTLISADLGGSTLAPGVYCSGSSMGLTGTLTLDAQNDPNAVFIFQMGSTLTTASAATVNVINGGQNCNVFWQVGSSATLGTTTQFVGSVVALTSITVTTGVSSSGRFLARNGAVTLDSNSISVCAEPPILSVTKSVTPNPVVFDASAVYTVVVSNGASQAQTQGSLVLHDTLASDITLVDTTGSDSGWSCIGTNELICTYTSTLLAGASTTLKLNVDIGLGALTGDNTARVSGGGDPLCPVPPIPAAARCSATVLTSMVPVVLSDIATRVEAGRLTVGFGTLTETGTLGYRVLTGSADRPMAVLNDEPIAAVGTQMQPQRYQVKGRHQGERQVWIEELTIDGRAIPYGPFPVGTRVGRRADSAVIDWSANRAEQSAFRARQRPNLRVSSNALEAELTINADGWYVVSYEDLLTLGLDWREARWADLRLRQGSTDVPMLLTGVGTFGPGSRLAFLGHAISGSLYTRNAVYRLSRGAAGVNMGALVAAPTSAAAVDSIRASFRHEPNRTYLAGAAGTDPWYALRLLRYGSTTVSASESFSLPERAADSSNEHIRVEVWGGIDYPQNPDHSIRLLVNGTEVADVRFDGISVRMIDVDLPAGLLSSSNTVTLQLVADTGLPADQIFLNAITVDYQRELRTNDNRLDFSLPADTLSSAYGGSIFNDSFETGSAPMCAHLTDCDHYQISGLTQAGVIVLRERAGSTVELTDVQISPASDGYRLDFASNRHPLDRYWIAPRDGLAPTLITAQPEIGDPLAGGQAQLLIIAHPSFIDRLDELVNARVTEGFSVRVVDIEGLYRRYSDGVIDPYAVQRAVADAYTRLSTRYVLLVGGDTYDYFNYDGSNSISFIPTHYRQTDRYVRYAPTDSVSADVNGDGLMDVALGRLPVRNSIELARAIRKTLDYPHAGHGGRLLLQADRADPLQFDEQLAAIANLLGTAWNVTRLSLDDYPSGGVGTAAARLALSSALDSGQAFTAYLGHSAPDRWTFSGLLSAQDIYNGFFSNAGQPTILWSLGCYGSYFVEPHYNTIAHAMMLQDGGGAAAVLGASGLTVVASDVAWINTLMLYLPEQRLGDAMMLSQRLLRASGGQFDDVAIGGNLLGDPTLRLNQQNPQVLQRQP